MGTAVARFRVVFSLLLKSRYRPFTWALKRYLLSAEEPISALLLHHKRVMMKVKVQGRFQHSLRAGASGVAQKVGTHASK